LFVSTLLVEAAPPPVTAGFVELGGGSSTPAHPKKLTTRTPIKTILAILMTNLRNRVVFIIRE
jgi:hypothetical protein